MLFFLTFSSTVGFVIDMKMYAQKNYKKSQSLDGL